MAKIKYGPRHMYGPVYHPYNKDNRFAANRIKRSGVKGSVEVYDYATPRLEHVKNDMGQLVEPYIMAAIAALKHKVVESYIDAKATSLPNTRATSEVKGRGKPPLYDTGALEASLRAASTDLQAYHGDLVGTYTLTFPVAGQRVYYSRLINGMRRREADFPYVWSHEMGAGPSRAMKRFGYLPGKWKVPRRPFLARGIREGMEAARGIVNAGLVGIVREMNGLDALQLPYPRFDLTKEFKWSGYDTLAMYAPPSALYAVGGRLSDFTSSLEGSFGLEHLGPWFTAWGMGSMGLTKKVQRRKMRRRIWA